MRNNVTKSLDATMLPVKHSLDGHAPQMQAHRFNTAIRLAVTIKTIQMKFAMMETI
jgi:hypothetical protein